MYAPGQYGGEGSHVLTEGEIPSHSHSVSLRYSGRRDGDLGSLSLPGNSYQGEASYRTAATGGGGGHNNMPPYFTINYLIKVV